MVSSESPFRRCSVLSQHAGRHLQCAQPVHSRHTASMQPAHIQPTSREGIEQDQVSAKLGYFVFFNVAFYKHSVLKEHNVSKQKETRQNTDNIECVLQFKHSSKAKHHQQEQEQKTQTKTTQPFGSQRLLPPQSGDTHMCGCIACFA